ncbi:hypothetical protein S40288_11284 [Stachybotrys chartarum IBT 40288]|nr:hypothetical protein S40288_11284 [Stachybotrys chartarum IBT 40288]
MVNGEGVKKRPTARTGPRRTQDPSRQRVMWGGALVGRGTRAALVAGFTEVMGSFFYGTVPARTCGGDERYVRDVVVDNTVPAIDAICLGRTWTKEGQHPSQQHLVQRHDPPMALPANDLESSPMQFYFIATISSHTAPRARLRVLAHSIPRAFLATAASTPSIALVPLGIRHSTQTYSATCTTVNLQLHNTLAKHLLHCVLLEAF